MPKPTRRRGMLSKLGALLISIVMVVQMLPVTTWAIGSHDIYSAEDLYTIRSYLSGTYRLMSDIDLSDYGAGYDGGAGWEPVGTQEDPFTGTFDGNGHIITGLYINRPAADNVGLFGYTGAGADIKNVTLQNVDITGHGNVGGLVGYNNTGSIMDTSTTGSLSGGDYTVGGLVGWNKGTIDSSSSTIDVTGDGVIGGLVGRNDGQITESYAEGAVISNNDNAGGLVGYNNGGVIERCYATGIVTGEHYDSFGGLVGGNSNGGSITDSYATGAADGPDCVGGLVGYNSDSSITSCYSTGLVSSEGDAGGLVGYSNGGITSSYFDASTTGQNDSNGGVPQVTDELMCQATFIGWNFVTVWAIEEFVTYPYLQWQSVGGGGAPVPTVLPTNGSFTDTDDDAGQIGGTITWTAANPTTGITGYKVYWGSNATTKLAGHTDVLYTAAGAASTSQAVATDTALPAGAAYFLIYSSNTGGDSTGCLAVSIRDAATPSGNGSEEEPYLIQSAANLVWMSQRNNDNGGFNNKYFKQTADIDMSAIAGFTPIGDHTTPFQGKYDGRGHKISDLTVNVNTQYAGLFGEIISPGEVKSLTLDDVSINSTYDHAANYVMVGGIAGVNTGTIQDCRITVSPAGESTIQSSNGRCAYAGGIAGDNQGTISMCSNAAEIKLGGGNGAGIYSAGGITGSNTGALDNCFNTGSISDTDSSAALIYLGGIAGQNLSSSVSYSYNTGAVTLFGGTGVKGGIVGMKSSSSEANNFFLEGVADNGIGANGFDPGTSEGAAAKTLEQLKNPSTFAGWDPTKWIFSAGSLPSLRSLAAAYTVTYNGNGATSGTAPTDSNGYAQGATVTVLGNTGNLTRTGYTFAGWNTAAEGSGTSYTAGATFAMGTANVILYARWTANQSSSDGGGGSNTSSQTSTSVTGEVIDSKTGETVKGLQAQVSNQTNGTTTVEVKSQEAILFQQPDGTQSPVSDLSKIGFSAAANSDAGISLKADGTIQISNLAQGTDSTFAVTFDLGNGQVITIGTIEVQVDANGQVSITSTLIDPYGVITDPATGQPMTDVQVTLYYADTERNSKNGKTPDTLVDLPILDGFKPNNNKNPQISDKDGAYAFMVFPTSDYYLVAEKDGYEIYRSTTISVEQEIVKWDFKMNKPLTGVKRLSGESRVDTALAVAGANYTAKLKNVVLATAANYPDALAGSVLAYKLNAPILLVGSTEADQNKILAYLQANLETGGTVYILGGAEVVGRNIENKISAAGFSKITRVSSSNRSATALKIADYLQVPAGRPVILVNEANYADALSISSCAAAAQYSIFLIGKDRLSPEVKARIAAIKPIKVYLIGGEDVISKTVIDQVGEITALNTENIVRIGGQDRYATALAVAEYFNLSGKSVCLATGRNYPDALAGSIYAANFNAPVILVNDRLSTNAINYLETMNLTGATIFGGETIVGKDIELQLGEIIKDN